MIILEDKTFAGVYNKICRSLVYELGKYTVRPHDVGIKEHTNAMIQIRDPYKNIFTNKYRNLPLQYLKDELLLYFAGRNDKEGFVKASKFWEKLANPNGTINSAYGYLLFKAKIPKTRMTQWDWVKKCILEDKDTRQALMFVANPKFQYVGNKDFICTTNYQFMIRNNKLNMTVNRRSQDIHFGMTYDIPWEMLLMQCMLVELQEKYPQIEMGEYVLHCTSLHIYDRNRDTIVEMLKYPFVPIETPRIKENPILNVEDYKGDDEFINWLKT